MRKTFEKTLAVLLIVCCLAVASLFTVGQFSTVFAEESDDWREQASEISVNQVYYIHFVNIYKNAVKFSIDTKGQIVIQTQASATSSNASGSVKWDLYSESGELIRELALDSYAGTLTIGPIDLDSGMYYFKISYFKVTAFSNFSEVAYCIRFNSTEEPEEPEETDTNHLVWIIPVSIIGAVLFVIGLINFIRAVKKKDPV